MCGIFGYIDFGKNTSNMAMVSDNIPRILTIMRNRGPDASGIERKDNCIFAHTRLAIIDIASGKQPWVDSDTGVMLTYNGEIYNYRELRTQLIGKGYNFESNCDTEVLVKAYLEWGEDCLDKFNGMFAFALFDPRSYILFAARDRLGIKPFWYAYSRDSFVFCSSIPGILNIYPDYTRPDYEAVSHYLTTGRPFFGERTLYANIKQLRPGQRLVLNTESADISIKKYWQIPIIPKNEKIDISFEDATAKIYSLINDSVRMRLAADVPVGAFLSGGLDSSVIGICAKRYTCSKLPLFCAGTEDADSNEFQYAELIGSILKEQLVKLVITHDTFQNDWEKLIDIRGLPLSTPNEISIYNLAKELRKGCTVALTGEGADEVFGGYVQPHFSGYDFDRCPRSPDKVNPLSSFEMSMTMLYGRSFFINDTDHYIATCSWFTFLDKEAVLDKDLWEGDLKKDEALFSFYEEFFSQLEGCSSIDKRLYLHTVFNLENLLSRIDNSTMLASVEARVPFTDHRIAELLFSMPDKYKIDWISQEAYEKGKNMTAADIDRYSLVESKRLLRYAFADMLPDEIVKRKKMSFPVPFTQWFYGPMFESVKEIIRGSNFIRDCFNLKAIENLFGRKHRNIWLLANLAKRMG